MNQYVENHTDDSQNIAIIGMAGRFPGAENLEQFWQIIKNGVESISFSSKEELAAFGVEEELLNNPKYVKANSVLSDIDLFDASFFGYSRREAKEMDPQQRIFLECAWEVIESSGYNPLTYDGSIGVYAGSGMPTYLLSNLHSQMAIDTRSFEQMLANDKDYLATRTAYKLNLTGPAITLQTACSTSLVAVHMACQSLLNGECDMALAGGISVLIPQEAGYLYQEGMILSPDGHCRAFDAKGKGTVFGNGVGIVLLKALEDAIEDGDRIQAVIKGSAINNDGSLKLGYTAPSVEGQTAVISEAQDVAGVDPETIAYIEAHGTGTELGDPIEIEALTKAFSKQTQKKQFCAVGSLKTNMGHLNTAAGIAGLMKTVLALQHKLIPPSLHFEQPNPQIDFANSPFFVNTTLSEWKSNGTPRRAGVSSFGVGGTNAHVILEEAPCRGGFVTRPDGLITRPEETVERPLHLLTLSAKTEKALEQSVSRYQQYLETHPELELADICYTASIGRVHFEHRLAVVAANQQELVEKLTHRNNGEEVAGLSCGQTSNGLPKIAFLFTGQGSQYVDMGRQLYEESEVFREAIDECDELLRSQLEKPLLDVIYPENAEESNAELLNQTAYTQPVLFALEYALAQLWQSWGIEPDIVMGHSVGEYVAATIAGIFSLEDGLKLIAARGKLMQQLPDGGEMVAVMASEKKVRELIAIYKENAGSQQSVVDIAAINGPKSTVISGVATAIREITSKLESEGIKTKKLQVSHAFHSPLMVPMLPDFEVVANQLTYHPPKIPIISNVTGEKADHTIAESDYWLEHVCRPVKFAQSMETLEKMGYRVFLEIGPKPTLLGMGHKCLPETEATWLPSLRPRVDEWEQMLSSLGQLYVRGASVDWSAFNQDLSCCRVPLPTYPFQRERCWLENSKPELAQRAIASSTSEFFYSPALPLIGQRLPLPYTQQIRFQTRLTPEFPSYVKDHRYYGKIVVAGASHIVMGLLAGQALLQSDACVIEKIEFLQILGVDEIGDKAAQYRHNRTIQLLLDPEGDKQYSYQLISCLAGTEQDPSGSWTLHATAKVREVKQSELTGDRRVIDIAAVQQRCARVLDSNGYYSEILDPLQGEFILGPTFQWTEAAWLGENEGLIQLKIPANNPQMLEFLPHPGMIDAGLILVGILVLPHQGISPTKRGQYAFAGAKSFKFFEKIDPSESLWYYTSLDELNGSVGSELQGNSYLLSSTGKVLAEFTGVTFRKLSQKLLLKSFGLDLSQWYYQLQWQPLDLAPVETKIEPKTYLLFTTEWGNQLYTALTSQGHRCIVVYPAKAYKKIDDLHYELNPTKPAFRKLFQALANSNDATSLAGIIHLWGLGTDAEELSKAQELTCAILLHLVQKIGSSLGNKIPPLWSIARGAQAIENTAITQPQQALLWGLGRVISMEHPELNCRCIDLDPVASEEQAFQDLVAELLSGDHENQIGYRQGKRYVARLAKASLQTHTELVISPESSYLITGGLGALGLEVARWLVEHGARHLVLVGRCKPSPTATECLQKLEQVGAEISVLLGDVAKQKDVAKIFQEIQTCLPTLKGLIHAAGALDDGLLKQMSWERFTNVTASKVKGTWNLHKATKELPLDFFVCFSSMSSLLGPPGQGSYAATNAFMDAIASHRRSIGLPGLSINWGAWAKDGMAARLGGQHQRRWETQGIQKIQLEQGLHALEEALTSTEAQLAVFPVDWQPLLAQYNATGIPPILREIANQFEVLESERLAGPKLGEFLEQLKISTTPQRQQLLTDYLIGIVAKVLGLTKNDLPDPEEGFFNLGMDSLVALDLSQKIQADLGISLTSTATFEYPNIQELAIYLEEIVPKAEVGEDTSPTPVTNLNENRLFLEVSELSEDEWEKSVNDALVALSKLL